MTLQGTSLPQEMLLTFGTTLVVAPHPDDETLACGGLIALLRRFNKRVGVVVVTDGGNSHPNSVEWPRERLTAVRRAETLDALGILGVGADDVHFLGCRDGELASQNKLDIDVAVQNLAGVAAQYEPSTIVLPFRGEGHSDHCVTWYMVRNAVPRLRRHPRLLEYPLWIGPATATILELQSPAIWKLDVSSVLLAKRRAISAIRSQLGELVQDDPSGFRLSPRLLDMFVREYEGFFEFAD